MVFMVLFAAATQMIMANAITPMVESFGGQANQMAWVKSIAVFGAIGLVFLAERVEVPANQEKFLTSLKYAVQNRYWLICVLFSLCTNMVLYMNLSISVYYSHRG